MSDVDRVRHVSVGLPVFNGECYVRFAIESILAQTFTDFELIISDNGSTDATADICRNFAATDPRITFYRHDENRGGAWNFNFVFHSCRGRYFKWACHDDVMAPTFLERCVEVMDRRPDVVLCYPKTLIIDGDGVNPVSYSDGLHMVSSSPVARFQQLLFRPMQRCNPVLGLIRRDALVQTDLIGAYGSSDEILLAHLALLGKYFEVQEELTFRRDHPGTSVRANPTPQQIYSWYNPGNHSKILLPTLRHFFEYTRCICRVRISLPDKARCAFLALKLFWWRRSRLWRELQLSIKSFKRWDRGAGRSG